MLILFKDNATPTLAAAPHASPSTELDNIWIHLLIGLLIKFGESSPINDLLDSGCLWQSI